MTSKMRLIWALAALSTATAALAGGNTPIRSDRQALRSVILSYAQTFEVPQYIRTLADDPRDIVDRAFRKLAATTTPASLATTPGGITLPCSIAGNLIARMRPGPLRVVHFEWVDCMTDEFGPANIWTTNGPAEVIFLGNSFLPKAVASIRFGDRERDLVRDQPVLDSPNLGGFQQRWNLRATGILPLREVAEGSLNPRRLTAHVDGFFESTSYQPAWPNPGPPFYPQVEIFAAEDLVISLETKDVAPGGHAGHTEDSRIVAGRLDFRLQTPTTPMRPGQTFDVSYRYADLRVQTGRYATTERNFVTVDGRLETNLAGYYGFPGCGTKETYTYRTRAPMLIDLGGFAYLYEGGELAVNQNVVAKFRTTGSVLSDEYRGIADIKVGGIGEFTFTAQYSLDDLVSEAGCSP